MNYDEWYEEETQSEEDSVETPDDEDMGFNGGFEIYERNWSTENEGRRKDRFRAYGSPDAKEGA